MVELLWDGTTGSLHRPSSLGIVPWLEGWYHCTVVDVVGDYSMRLVLS